MPDRKTLERVEEDRREGKAPSTQAGEFVREEIEHICEGKHGARSTKQAIAIGLSKARRAGVDLPPPKAGTVSKKSSQARIPRSGIEACPQTTSKNSRPPAWSSSPLARRTARGSDEGRLWSFYRGEESGPHAREKALS